MRVTKKLWWQELTGSIIGFDEGDPAGGASGEGEPGAAGEGNGEGDGSTGTGGEGNQPAEDTAGLKSALEKERADRKALEKEVRALRKTQQSRDDAEKTEVQRATEAEARTAEKVAKLAAQFKSSAIESAIVKAARIAKFTDPTDAVRPEVIAALSVEQDEDDPTKVEIDEASVTAAIKKLAREKPHWLTQEQKGTPKPKSGSSFGGSGTAGTGGQQVDPERAALLNKYPALRGRV